MGLLENVYDSSPIFFQNIMVTLSGYQRNTQRYGKAYYKFRDFLADFDTWPLQKKLDYQRDELIKLLHHAKENSKFYGELYKDININKIQSVEDLKMLPVVDKEMIRSNIEDVIAVSKRGTVEGHTGGTTGKSLVVLFEKEDKMKQMAMLDHFKSRVGFENRKMKRATFNGKHIIPPRQEKKVFWRYNAACKQMIYSSFYITEENMGHYVDSLNRYKPEAIDGFFMSMCDIAGYIERHNIKLTFTPVAVFPTSETLTQEGRELLERVFRAKVYDQYASSEGAPFVTECKDNTLHQELALGVFEYAEEGKNDILVTSFYTYGTPLIRYQIGDDMVFDDDRRTCKCGMDAPVVRKIQGRNLDYLYTAAGSKITTVNIANGFKNIPNAIIKSQVIQDRVGEILIKLEVDKSLYKPEYDDLLKDEFIHKLGRGTDIIINHVDEIPREKSGKFKLIKNNVKDVI